MPRDGSGVYTQPFPDVVSGTTIESAKYNGNVNDVEQDLNTPRPIVAGGTGAATAHDALINLHGEESKQGPVTNFDTFPFVNGSFFCNGSATGAPNANAFVGSFYEHNNPQYATLTAWDVFDPLKTSYTRLKAGGTWGAWSQNIGTQSDADARYVNGAGDTMTGNLVVPNFSANGNVTSGAGATTGNYFFGNTGTKYLTYNGTNFSFSGGNVIVPILLCSGDVYSGSASATAGTYFFGSNGTKYLSHDGTNYSLTGGPLLLTSTSLYVGYGNGATGPGGIVFGSSGTKGLNYISPQAYLNVGSNLVINSDAAAPGIIFQLNSTTAWQFSVQNPPFYLLNAGATAGVQLPAQSSTSWAAYSDARLKENVETLSALDMLTNFRAIRYTYTPTGVVEIGVIAQEVVNDFPELVTRGSDGELREVKLDEPGTVWAVSYDRFAPIALQGVKELHELIKAQATEINALKTRLEALEAA